MRDNTTLTKLMDKYMQRDPGREALVRILTAPVESLLASPAEYSLDPAPLAVWADLSEAGALPAAEGEADEAGPASRPTEEAAAAMPEVAAEVERRLTEGSRVAAAFLDAITSVEGIEALPYGTRWMAKRIFALARAKFARGGGAALDGVYSLLGGFLFLRYINPRIVAPETIGITPSAPAKRMRRNLTIIAKMLQSLSNNVVGQVPPHPTQALLPPSLRAGDHPRSRPTSSPLRPPCARAAGSLWAGGQGVGRMGRLRRGQHGAAARVL
jgi:Ras GTPase-activating-like protein IQGAP2/3